MCNDLSTFFAYLIFAFQQLICKLQQFFNTLLVDTLAMGVKLRPLNTILVDIEHRYCQR